MSDPFTASVIQSGFDAASQEMFDVLRKTAMSPIIYEVLDVGTGITDAEGQMVSSGAGIPSFVGVLDKSVAAILARERGRIAEGDVFILNDPNHGGVTHLNDVIVAEPVFYDGQLFAWVASIAHWGDIGGRTPGSMAADVSEIVAEGLRLPIVRLYEGGRANAAVFDIIRANTRLADFVAGDLAAQISAGRRAASMLCSIAGRYGMAALSDAVADAIRTGHRRALQGLARLPKGRFEIAEPQDDGSVWSAAIEVTDDSFVVDLRDAPPEADGPHNTSRDGAFVACQILFKALTDPERFANAGSFAPLQVLTTPGTVFHAGPRAAQGYYFETRIRLFDLLLHCMARRMPDRLPAGNFATIFGTVIAGTHPDTGRAFAMVEPQMGGWGATANRSGTGPLFSTSHGDTFNCPAEIAEARYGLEVAEVSLLPAPDAPRGSSGGPGLRKRYCLAAPARLSVGYSHAKVPVWSADGEEPGGLNSLHVVTAAGTSSSYRFASDVILDVGDEVVIETAFGGRSAQAEVE